MSKRTSKYWRGWMFSRYSPRGWWMLRTPFGSIGVDHHRAVTKQGFSRGRCRERELRIPLTSRWQIHLSTKADDYLTLVNGPEYLRSIDWILDEFDASFNALAVASLRYHLDWSICDMSRHRAQYEDLIRRLTEPAPRYTDEELAVLCPPGWSIEDEFEQMESGNWGMRESTPEQDAIHEVQRRRESDWHARINQARHDFVDVMPGLWS